MTKKPIQSKPVSEGLLSDVINGFAFAVASVVKELELATSERQSFSRPAFTARLRKIVEVIKANQPPLPNHPTAQVLEIVANFVEQEEPTSPGHSEASNKTH